MATNRRFLPVALLACALGSTPARTYWDFGHETVAAIAWGQLTPKVRARVRGLIAHAAALGTPACPIRDIESASVWPDCIKADRARFGHAYRWHFQNLDICKPFDIAEGCADGDCVSAQIVRNEALLKDRKAAAAERLIALSFLVHLMGDLHQPLHAADHNGDEGGNKVHLRYGEGGPRTTLHKIWDGYLAERAITTPPAGGRGLLSSLSPAERKHAARGTIADWTRENWEVARTTAYAVAPGSDPCAADARPGTLGNTAIAAAIPVVRRQIARGGLRLARLLDEALG